MKKSFITLLFTVTLLLSAGYQVPMNSINSTALDTANVAHAHGADSSYYNPANMVYNENKHILEAAVMYTYLSPIDYMGDTSFTSKSYDSFVPSIHYVSDKLNESGLRIGFATVVPYGLGREWEDQPAMATAKKYELEVIELNPSIAIPLSKSFSLGLGLRYMRAEGKVKLDAGPVYSVDMIGKDDALGYNIALSYRPTDTLSFAFTYRSAMTLNLQGDADVTLGAFAVNTSAALEVVIPDNFVLASAYTVNNKTTLEVTLEMTRWSRVTETDFNYANLLVEANLGQSSPARWRDTYAYNLGITHKFDSPLTLMGGLGYSTNNTSQEYVTFSSPEADNMTYSIGGRYAFSDNFEFGLAVLYADYKDRTSSNSTVDGTFTNQEALAITTGVTYKF